MRFNKYEKAKDPMLPFGLFLRRLARHGLLALLIVGGSLLIGTGGYHFFENLTWLDSLLNASMILGGMGPVNALQTVGGKLFASFYALFSGMVFLAAAGVLFAPLFHRFLHRLHLDDDDPADRDP